MNKETEIQDLPEAEVPAIPDELAGISTAEWADKYARLLADFDNFRKRSRESNQKAALSQKTQFILELLDVVDNFERALESCHVSCEKGGLAESQLDGIQAIDRQLRKLFESHAIKPVDTVGKSFDPNLHEAIGTEENSEVEAGTILHELSSGWIQGEDILRPARVIVASESKQKEQ